MSDKPELSVMSVNWTAEYFKGSLSEVRERVKYLKGTFEECEYCRVNYTVVGMNEFRIDTFIQR